MALTFDPDDYELRWPPQLFVDEADRLRRRKVFTSGDLLGHDGWALDMEWLLTEAFVSTVPTEAFKAAMRSGEWGSRQQPGPEAWVSELLRQAAKMAGARFPQAVLVCPHERSNEANPARVWRSELELCPADRGIRG